MASDAPSHDATFWLQLDAEFYGGDNPKVRAIKASALTQKRPRTPRNAVIVKITVRVPDAAFLPLRPEAVVVIPEDMTVVDPVLAQVVEPDA